MFYCKAEDNRRKPYFLISRACSTLHSIEMAKTLADAVLDGIENLPNAQVRFGGTTRPSGRR